MRHLYIFFTAFMLFVSPAAAESQAEADLLLGPHLFADSELATVGVTSFYKTFGTAKILHESSLYKFKADTECYQREPYRPDFPKGGYTHLEGNITTISSESFTIYGTLDVFYLPNTGPNPKWDNTKNFKCQITGNFVFSRKGHPDYWRMQTKKPLIPYEEALPMEKNECLSYVGSIDIFVKPLEGPAPHSDCVRNIKDFHTLPDPVPTH